MSFVDETASSIDGDFRDVRRASTLRPSNEPIAGETMSYMEMGGPFMYPMLWIGVAGLGLLGYAIYGSMQKQEQTPTAAVKAAEGVKHIAIFLLVTGILMQAIGLYDALMAIERIGGEVSPALLASGLKVSLISPIFGMIEFLVLIAGYAIVKTRL